MGGCGFLFTTFAYVAPSRGTGLFALRQPAPHELQMLTQTRKPSWSVLVADWSTWVRISTHRLVYIDLTLPDLVFNPKRPLFVWTVAMLAFEAGTKADFFCTGTHFLYWDTFFCTGTHWPMPWLLFSLARSRFEPRRPCHLHLRRRIVDGVVVRLRSSRTSFESSSWSSRELKIVSQIFVRHFVGHWTSAFQPFSSCHPL